MWWFLQTQQLLPTYTRDQRLVWARAHFLSSPPPFLSFPSVWSAGTGIAGSHSSAGTGDWVQQLCQRTARPLLECQLPWVWSLRLFVSPTNFQNDWKHWHGGSTLWLMLVSQDETVPGSGYSTQNSPPQLARTGMCVASACGEMSTELSMRSAECLCHMRCDHSHPYTCSWSTGTHTHGKSARPKTTTEDV